MKIRNFCLSGVYSGPESFKLEVNNKYLVAGIGIILTGGALIFGLPKFYDYLTTSPAKIEQIQEIETQTHAQPIKSDLSERLK